MSSYWAGYSMTGLVLTQPEFNAMLIRYMEKNPEQKLEDLLMEGDFILNDISFIKSVYAGEPMPLLWDDGTKDYMKILDEYGDKLMNIVEILDGEMDGVTFWPFYKSDGVMNINRQGKDGEWEFAEFRHPIWDSDADICYFIQSDKDMSSPKAFEEKPYASYQDFVQEFKDKLESYLPDDFDWNAHLGYISYAAFA